MFHTDTADLIIRLSVIFLGLCLIGWLLIVKFVLKPRAEQAGLVEPHGYRGDDFYDDGYDDEDYLRVLHSAKNERMLAPAFAGQPARSDIPRPIEPTSILRPLPDPMRTRPMSNEELAMALEKDDYLTGRTMRILRREREEREGWHWNELLGEWEPGRDLIDSLPYDDWLRELLEDRVAA